ncbi:CPBP family glutamic-type intramembrane protease [Gracilibacillus lacisalsi]|uniref:CPBP family glutamic-type intramembrane protease n=1 Tax=Gracilibacillus lacisalsi TaxID=393087 RepID=UPI001FE0EA4C|nr:CPBP family glutamic-type intramembrane protease [Gracilibacillus lacisalsi]
MEESLSLFYWDVSSYRFSFFGIFLAASFGWISIEKWHTPDQWLIAILVNMGIAFLYEALPEELALRGFVFDVLRHRFATWVAVQLQTLIFLSVPLTTTLLQVLIGLAPGNSINVGYIMLILFRY